MKNRPLLRYILLVAVVATALRTLASETASAKFAGSASSTHSVLHHFQEGVRNHPPQKRRESEGAREQRAADGDRHIRNLYGDLFRDYQKEIRPVLNDSKPLAVAVQFWLKQILKVDERDQTLVGWKYTAAKPVYFFYSSTYSPSYSQNVYCWLELYWTDELLKWDSSAYGGLDRIHVPAAKIWRPDILVYNNANMNIKENEMETNAIIKSNGEVTLFRALITDITCALSLSLFPFDRQACFLTFASWSMDGSKLVLVPLNNMTSLDLYSPNTEWELTDFSVKMYEKVYACCPAAFPDITYFIALKRSPSYYIFSLIIPSAFITVVTIVGFFTPHSTTGENTEKVSTAVTALLSMTIIMMMVSDEVPATSEVIPLIGKYYIGLIFIIFIAAFTTTGTLAFQMRGNAGRRMGPAMRYLLFESMAKSLLGSWLFTLQITDRRSVRHFRIHQRGRKSQRGSIPYGEDWSGYRGFHLNRSARPRGNNTILFKNSACRETPLGDTTSVFTHGSPNRVNAPVENADSWSPALPNNVSRSDAEWSAFQECKRAKIVRMSDLLESEDEISRTASKKKETAAGCTIVNDKQYLIYKLHECVSTIEESIIQAHEQKYIEFEWEQGTRIIERLMMIFYILLTVAFAVFMLGDVGEDIRLTNETMDKIKR